MIYIIAEKNSLNKAIILKLSFYLQNTSIVNFGITKTLIIDDNQE